MRMVIDSFIFAQLLQVRTGHLAIVRCISGNANTGTSVLGSGIVKVSAMRYYQVSYSNSIAGAANMSFDLFQSFI